MFFRIRTKWSIIRKYHIPQSCDFSLFTAHVIWVLRNCSFAEGCAEGWRCPSGLLRSAEERKRTSSIELNEQQKRSIFSLVDRVNSWIAHWDCVLMRWGWTLCKSLRGLPLCRIINYTEIQAIDRHPRVLPPICHVTAEIYRGLVKWKNYDRFPSVANLEDWDCGNSTASSC